MINEGILLGVL
jgi:hypothetical protein